MTTLIVPGYHGSGKRHWQTWIEKRIPDARRVLQEWDVPILASWAHNVRRAIVEAEDAVWLIAHSFGCLASVAASADMVGKVAGVMLVAPANPDLFTPGGVRQEDDQPIYAGVRDLLPAASLPFPSLLIASTSDPWLPYTMACDMAESWGSRLVTLQDAGHINIAAGFGSWPQGLQLFRDFQRSHYPNGLEENHSGNMEAMVARGRGGHMARIRHITRRHFGY